jgi:hypothetical protein
MTKKKAAKKLSSTEIRFGNIEERLCRLEKKEVARETDLVEEFKGYQQQKVKLDEFCPCCGKKKIQGPFFDYQKYGEAK